MRSGLERLRALLHEHGGLIASLLTPPEPGAGERDGSPAAGAAAGPRAAGRREEYELLVEAIYEGYLLHYGAARVVLAREPDLRVLAGDQLYAIGLARLVALGDTQAVAELADTITLSALAHAGAGEPGDGAVAPSAPARRAAGVSSAGFDQRRALGHELAAAVWAAGAHAVGWGPSDAHRRAKELAFAGAPEAIEAMRTSPGAASPS
jgi:hypothetical protein